MTGGGFAVNQLTDSEIEWIYDNATHIASGSVTFSRAFRDRILQYSEGMPWIAQHVGYEAVFAELAPARKRGEEQLDIDIVHFPAAMTASIEHYRARFNEKYRIEVVLEDRGPTGFEVLKTLLQSREAMTEAALKSGLPGDQGRLKRWVPTALEKFVEFGVLAKRGDSYAFPNALLRIFTRYYIDEVEVSFGTA